MRRPRSLAPEILEPRRRQLRVPDGVLNIAVTQVGLHGPGVVAGVGEREAAGMPQHVRVNREGELCGYSRSLNHPVTRTRLPRLPAQIAVLSEGAGAQSPAQYLRAGP
jgi:hypothetical protein